MVGSDVAKQISLKSFNILVKYFFFRGSLLQSCSGSIPRELSKIDVAMPGQAAANSSVSTTASIKPQPSPPYFFGMSPFISPDS
jgi:hypothetical protein